jgi:ABC-type cobalamin/Fe3+-siderophores transport system ATPase subunit
MITRIELTNFMSHAHTVIEPAAGLTVIVGPNNCGKSALVAALQILRHNEKSTYVMRHGTKECSVKVWTDDGHTIEWRRKTSPSYVIDGHLFDRLRGGGVPDELVTALRLPFVEAGGEAEFDVHFGAQKSPIFLLDQSPATAARFFSSSSDASRLLLMQKRHKEKLAQRQRDKVRLEAESRQVNAELAALEPAVDLERRVKESERLADELALALQRIEAAERDVAAMVRQASAVARHESQAGALAPLAAPPALEPTGPLETLIARCQRAAETLAAAQARGRALAPLSVPPELADDRSLARSLREQEQLAIAVRRADRERQILAALAAPPPILETEALSRLASQLDAAQRQLARAQALAAAAQVGTSLAEPPTDETAAAELARLVPQIEAARDVCERRRQELSEAETELSAAELAMREFAASSLCPTCGSPLDADRWLASAGSGSAALGGHAHD